MNRNCRHLGDMVGVIDTPFGREHEFTCTHQRYNTTTLARCVDCETFLAAPVDPDKTAAEANQSRDEGECPHPTGVLLDRYGRDCHLADLYLGASCFLVLGGPSVKTMPLELLSRRGVLIMSVNNCPAQLPPPLRPHIWLHTDPPGKFHSSIFRDPGVLCFVPVNEWNIGAGKNAWKRVLRHRVDGKLVDIPMAAIDCPGVVGFERNTAFFPDKWMWEPKVNRGNDRQHAFGDKKKGTTPNGFPHVINTMFAALRLAFYLGIKRLYLVGADFRMDPHRPYGFNQGKSAGGVNSNNHTYAKMWAMFNSLVPHFERAGFEVFNCTPGSNLDSFPDKDFEEAIAETTEPFEQELRTDEWYDLDEDGPRNSG